MTDEPDGQLRFEDILVGSPPKLRVEYLSVPIGDVDLDPDNPRMKYRSQLEGTTLTHAEMLLRDEATKHLKQDIKASGMLERPFVIRHGARYVTKEGNRRVTVQKDLHKDEPTNPRWQTIAVRVLPDEITDVQMATMLAAWHITGKQDWSAHERAGHIYYMSEKLRMPDETIKVALHMGMPAIHKAVAAYKMLMERFVVVNGGEYKDKAEGKFSFFDEFQKSKALRERAQIDSFFEGDFCRWVGEGRIKRAEDVRKLADILEDKMADRMFKETTDVDSAFRLATEVLENSDPARRSDFFAKLKSAIKAAGKATVADFKTAASPSGRQLLADARTMLETINRHADNAVAALPLRSVGGGN